MAVENVSGRLSMLRVHDLGTKFGPPNDRIDVEVVVQFAGESDGAYGMKLRADANGPAREGMLNLLRDGFNHNWVVNIDFHRDPGRKNVELFRVWLTKPGGLPPVTKKPKAKAQASKKTAKKRAPRLRARA